jgi:tRNA nucleotidyltransferase (CCA-adding enzyme)
MKSRNEQGSEKMSHLEDQKMAGEIARLVAEKGGRTFYVGGFVRDALLHRENKDVDMEVHGISPAAWRALQR